MLEDARAQLLEKACGSIMPQKDLIRMAVVVSAEHNAITLWQLEKI